MTEISLLNRHFPLIQNERSHRADLL